MTGNHRFHSILIALIGLGAVLAASSRAEARIRLENICSVYGQKEVKLTGVGLVVGLDGTGDGGDNLPAMRALASALKLMNSPVLSIEELQDAENVAIVLIEATIPKTGLRRGQKIDCYISSFMGAESLRGGRLLVTPVETSEIGNDTAVGLASGPIYIEDSEIPTNGKIPGGIVLQKDFISLFIDKKRGHIVTLLLDEAHASFHSASEVARVINAEFSFEAKNKQLARSVGPGVVEIKVPEQYHDAPVEFVAQVLAVSIDNPHTQARVIVNPKSGTVIVTGEVEISPVVISHRNLTVAVGGNQEQAQGAPTGQFIPVGDNLGQPAPQQLKDLVDALNRLQVPTEDVISIIRELHRSGKLHAEYEER